jgi:hypothetical protein
MTKDNKNHDWNKEQPHDAKNGRFVPEKVARNNPNKVEWVKEKKK